MQVIRQGRAAIIIMALALCSCIARKDDSTPITATICALSQRPNVYDGRVVKLSAHVISDGIEHTLLFDPTCSRSPLIVTRGPQRHSNVHELTDVIYGKQRGTLNREIEATFVGTFKSPNKIELLSASHVVVRPMT